MSDAAAAMAAAGAIGDLVVRGITALASLGDAGQKALDQATERMRAERVPDSIDGAIRDAVRRARERVGGAAPSGMDTHRAELERRALALVALERGGAVRADVVAARLALGEAADALTAARRSADDTRPTPVP